MRYHNITKDDMLNGKGLRVVFWVAGCSHHCKGCQNPFTWDCKGGLEFNETVKKELFTELEKDYINGITLSGGDPLFEGHRNEMESLCKEIKEKFPTKTIWAYTGYEWEDVKDWSIINYIDVVLVGKFVKELLSPNKQWVGSSNQRVIDVKKSLEQNKVVLVS